MTVYQEYGWKNTKLFEKSFNILCNEATLNNREEDLDDNGEVISSTIGVSQNYAVK